MKFNFRQGIQHATLVSGHPSFLTYNPGSSTITINGSSDLVRATAASEIYNYLIEERTDTVNAWGPFDWIPAWGPEPVGNYTLYLYWNINRSTGLMTRSFTPRAPIFGIDLPLSPAIDQHWFDLSTNIMKVWDGTWKKVIRVFAGEFTIGTPTITEYGLGTQVGLLETGDQVDWPDHGYILFGADMKGIRYSDTNFVTTATQINTNHGSFASPIRLELLNSTVLAGEPIPAFYAITNIGDGTVLLANGTVNSLRPVGISLTNAIPGDPIDIVTHGILFNDQWNWDVSTGKKDLYCGSAGVLFQGDVSFSNGVSRVGSILSPQTILVNIDLYTISGGGAGPTGPSGPPGTASSLSIHNYNDSIILGLTDIDGMARINSASANTVTIPPISDVSFQVGDTAIISQIGVGITSIVGGSGVTINTPASLDLGMQFGKVTITMVANDEWDLEGNLA